MLENQNSLFVSDALKGVLNYESLYDSIEEELHPTNNLFIDDKKFEMDLLTMESIATHQDIKFKMQMKVPAFKMKDYLQLSKKNGTAQIDGVVFALQSSDLHWDVKNKIMTCFARLKDGEQTV
jgi:hypothetical protein